MSYYELNEAQTQYLRDIIVGKAVVDLGSGNGSLCVLAMDTGATSAQALDKDRVWVGDRDPRVKYHEAYFHQWEYPSPVDLALLSWPRNMNLTGLLRLLHGVKQVLYIGKNTDGVSCGFPDMFKYLSTREVLRYLPDRKNVMIHYGPGDRPDPGLYHEEWAGLSDEQICGYQADPEPKHVRGLRK